ANAAVRHCDLDRLRAGPGGRFHRPARRPVDTGPRQAIPGFEMTADPQSAAAAGMDTEDPQTAAVVRKVTRHLMPVLGLMYLIAYIDRQNIGYAKLQMVGDLGLTETSYGLGASLFFIGYLLFEVPSNLILARVGARAWFARIMISWGLV